MRSWTASKADLNRVLLASWKPQTSTCSQTKQHLTTNSIIIIVISTGNHQLVILTTQVSLCTLSLQLHTTNSSCLVLSTCFRNLWPMPLFMWAPSIRPGRSATEIYRKFKKNDKYTTQWGETTKKKVTEWTVKDTKLTCNPIPACNLYTSLCQSPASKLWLWNKDFRKKKKKIDSRNYLTQTAVHGCSIVYSQA